MAAGKDTPKEEEEKQEPSTSSVRRESKSSKSFWPWKREADGSASFLRAARAGNLDKVLEFLKTNTDINTCNANGLNALHLASKEGHSNVVAALIERKANVDSATKKGNTALHIASLAGQDEIVKVLVENSACVNIQSQNGFTPLYMAAQENHDSVVRYLLSHGANQSLATEDGFTPLAVALQQGHDRVVSVLLENDTRGKVRLPALHIAAKKDDAKAAALLLHTDHNPDITSKSGFTPLHIAAHYGNDNIAALLIQRGADVNYVAKHQITPLHVASKWGKGNMVSLLVDKGATIEAKTKDGLTPLHCAARSGHETVVDMLLEKGAPITAKTKNGLAPLHMASQGDHVDAARILLYHKAPVDDVTVDFLTALHVAAHCGHVRVAKLLLDRKADPNSRALNGFTPLHIACKKNRIKVVELLLKHGASIEATTESGLTPLHVASFMGCMNIVIYLIQHGASADVPTIRGESPLHLAARANQTDIIRILLRNGAEVDAKAREQQTALHIASRLGNADIVGLLLQQGASPDAPTKDLYTPLHIAAKEGQEEVAGVLLDHGASLNTPTKKGFTPLHLAAKYGHMKVARLLLQREAPVDPKGKNGVTPLHVAAHYDHQNVAMLLLDKGAQPHATAKNGYTPLHIAARKNQMDIAGTLLEYGANSNAESKAGFTPLHLSAQEGHTDMATLLLEHGAQAGGAAKNGLTPLHLCAQEDRVPVGAILVKNGASIDPTTKAGYTPLHVASHFGQMNMVKFLLQHGTKVDAPTQLGYTPLHQAAQQGHTQIVNLLLENKAQPNMETNDGKTALSIAQRLGYISVVETLKIVTETRVTTNTTTTTEEKYKVVVPETMHETFMSESEDEGADDTMLGDQSYRYLTVDEMKSLGDDSLPIDVTRDEKMDMSFQSTGTGGAPVDHISPQKKEMMYSQMYPADNVDVGRAPILAGPESLNTTMNTSFNPAEEDGTHIVNDESLQRVPDQGTTQSSHSPATVTQSDDSKLSHSNEALNGWEQFLVSFMVDARGGAMRGCRHSGVRVIIPPRKASMPMRITCRYLKKDKLVHAPPLMEGEALGSRILEMGPSGAKFLGPVIIEVPHFASLRGKEREIVILRSDNGETWREHTLEATEEAVQEVLNESFDGEELKQLEDLNTSRITRILTTDFPQYFAIVTRIRQEVHAIGPEGGMVSSTVVPQVQAVFPQGALTKKIKVGLQAQPISTDLVAKLLGNRVAVSPIVTVEPRRRKFHKPITLTIPVPQAASKGMINQYSGDTPTLRLLCSITGGTTRAQWEDVTGSTPLTFVNDCVSFTTTVSARFWLMDCTNIPEATKMATELYREAIHVPFMAKFVVFSKRHAAEEARVRVFCMTDDKEDKTLETQEHFIEVAKSRDVEVLEGKSQYLEFGGNLIPVTKSGDQLAFNFNAFRENRLPFVVRVKDQNAEPAGRVAFMRQPKVGRGEAPQSPICTLNLSLPDNIQPEPAPSEPDLLALEKKYAFLSINKADTIHKADLRLSDISNMLGSDWVALAKALDISDSDINIIKSQYPGNVPQQAIVMLRLWMQLAGNRATGNTLEKGLRSIHRDDIVDKCITNLEVVTDESEKEVAKERLEPSPLKPLEVATLITQKVDGSPEVSYDEKDIMKEAESAEEDDDSQRILQEREKDMSPTYEREERKYAAEEKIFKEYEDIISEQRKNEKSPPKDDRKSPLKDDIKSPKDDIKTPPKDDRKAPPKEDRKSPPKDDRKSPLKEDIKPPPKEDRKSPPKDDRKSPPKDDKKYVKEETYSKEEKMVSEVKTEESIKTKGREIEIETKEESFKETKEKMKEQVMEQFPDKKRTEKKEEEKETLEERKMEEKKFITKGEPTKPAPPATTTQPETKVKDFVTEVITAEQRSTNVEAVPSKQPKEELLLKLGEELGKLDQKLEEKFKEKQKESVPNGQEEEVVENSIVPQPRTSAIQTTSQVVVESFEKSQLHDVDEPFVAEKVSESPLFEEPTQPLSLEVDIRVPEPLPTAEVDTRVPEPLPTAEVDIRATEQLPTAEVDIHVPEPLPTAEVDIRVPEPLPTAEVDIRGVLEPVPTYDQQSQPVVESFEETHLQDVSVPVVLEQISESQHLENLEAEEKSSSESEEGSDFELISTQTKDIPSYDYVHEKEKVYEEPSSEDEQLIEESVSEEFRESINEQQSPILPDKIVQEASDVYPQLVHEDTQVGLSAEPYSQFRENEPVAEPEVETRPEDIPQLMHEDTQPSAEPYSQFRENEPVAEPEVETRTEDSPSEIDKEFDTLQPAVTLQEQLLGQEISAHEEISEPFVTEPSKDSDVEGSVTSSEPEIIETCEVSEQILIESQEIPVPKTFDTQKRLEREQQKSEYEARSETESVESQEEIVEPEPERIEAYEDSEPEVIEPYEEISREDVIERHENVTFEAVLKPGSIEIQTNINQPEEQIVETLEQIIEPTAVTEEDIYMSTETREVPELEPEAESILTYETVSDSEKLETSDVTSEPEGTEDKTAEQDILKTKAFSEPEETEDKTTEQDILETQAFSEPEETEDKTAEQDILETQALSEPEETEDKTTEQDILETQAFSEPALEKIHESEPRPEMLFETPEALAEPVSISVEDSADMEDILETQAFSEPAFEMVQESEPRTEMLHETPEALAEPDNISEEDSADMGVEIDADVEVSGDEAVVEELSSSSESDREQELPTAYSEKPRGEVGVGEFITKDFEPETLQDQELSLKPGYEQESYMQTEPEIEYQHESIIESEPLIEPSVEREASLDSEPSEPGEGRPSPVTVAEAEEPKLTSNKTEALEEAVPQDGVTQPSVDESQMVQGVPASTDVKPPISAGGQTSSEHPQSDRAATLRNYGTQMDIELNVFKQMLPSPPQEVPTDLTLQSDDYVYFTDNTSLSTECLTPSKTNSQSLQEDFTTGSGTTADFLSEDPGEMLPQTLRGSTKLVLQSTSETYENETNDPAHLAGGNELKDAQSIQLALENKREVKTAFTRTVETHINVQNVCPEEQSSINSQVNSEVTPSLEYPIRTSSKSSTVSIVKVEKCSAADHNKKRTRIASRTETVQLFPQSSTKTQKNRAVTDDVIGLMAEGTEAISQIKNEIMPDKKSKSPTSVLRSPLLEFRDLNRCEKQESGRLPTITEAGKEIEEGTSRPQLPTITEAGKEIEEGTSPPPLPTITEVGKEIEEGTSPPLLINESVRITEHLTSNVSTNEMNYSIVHPNSNNIECSSKVTNQHTKAPPQNQESNMLGGFNWASLRTVVKNNAFTLIDNSSTPVENVTAVEAPSGTQNTRNNDFKTESQSHSYISKSGIDLKLSSARLGWIFDTKPLPRSENIGNFDRKCEFCAKDMLLNDVCSDIGSLISVVEEGITLSKSIDVNAMLTSLDLLKFKVGRIFDFTFSVRPESEIYFQSCFVNDGTRDQKDLDYLFKNGLETSKGSICNKERNIMPVIKETVPDKQPLLIVSNEANGQDFLTDTEEVFSEGDVTPQSSPKLIAKKVRNDSDDEKQTDEENVEGSEDEIEDKQFDPISVEKLMPLDDQETLSFTEGYARTESPLLSDNESFDKQDIEGRHDKNVKRTIQDMLLEGKESPQGNTDEENMSDSAAELLENDDTDTQANLPECYMQGNDSVSDHQVVKSISVVPLLKSVFGSKKSRSSRKQQLLLEVQEEEIESTGTTDVEDIPRISCSKDVKPKPKRKRPRRKKKANVPQVSETLVLHIPKEEGATDTEILSEDKKSSTSSSESSDDFQEQYLFSLQQALELLTDTEDMHASDIDETDLDSKPVEKLEPSVIPEPYSENIKISEAESKVENEPHVDTDEEAFNLDDQDDKRPLMLPAVTLDFVGEEVYSDSDTEERLTDIDDVNIDDKEDEEIINDMIRKMPPKETNILREMDCQSDSVSNTRSGIAGTGSQALSLLEEGDKAVTDVEEWDEKGGIKVPKKKPYKPKPAKTPDTDSDSNSTEELEELPPPRIKGRIAKRGASRRLPFVPQVSKVESVETNKGLLSIVITPENWNEAMENAEYTQSTLLNVEGDSEDAVTDIEDVASQDEMDDTAPLLSTSKAPVTDTEDFEGIDSSHKYTQLPESQEISVLPSPKREKIHIVEDEFGIAHVKIENLDDDAPDVVAESEQTLTDSENMDVTEDDALRMMGVCPLHEETVPVDVLPLSEPTEISTKTKTKSRKHTATAPVCDEGEHTDTEELLPGKKGKRRGKGKKDVLKVSEEHDGNTDVEYLDEKAANIPSLSVVVDSPSSTDYEQFEASGGEESEVLLPRDFAATPEILKAAIKRTIVYKECPGGTIRTEIQEEAPNRLKLNEEPSGLTDIEDVEVSEAEEAVEAVIRQDACLPDNEESRVLVSVKTFIPHSEENEENEIKDNLLLPDDNHGNHTDVESLDEGEETGEYDEAFPADGSKTEDLIAETDEEKALLTLYTSTEESQKKEEESLKMKSPK